MPRITDYNTLLATIKSFLNREDLDEVLPTLVQMAEAMFNRELRWRKMIVRDTIADPGLTDEVYENLPDDFLELHSIRFNTQPVVVPQYMSPVQLEMFRAACPTAAGTPQHYTLVANQLRFDRVPTGSPPLELSSYVAIPSLDDQVQTTNVLLNEHPDIYLFAALISAEAYLDNDPRLPTWISLYQVARDRLMQSDRRASRSPGPVRIRSARRF